MLIKQPFGKGNKRGIWCGESPQIYRGAKRNS